MGYASGIGLRELARSMNVPAGTILSRAQREGWSRQKEEAKALAASAQSNAITATQGAAASLYERGQRHVERMTAVSERVMPHVEALGPHELLDGIEKIDRYDRLARRQYGLETTSGEKIGLQINFLSSPTIESRGTVIEVEPGEN